jgi:hypothetical protein
MKVTKKHYLTRVQWSWDREHYYCLYPFQMEGEQYVTVRAMDIELDIPDDFDPREQQIAALEKQRQKAMADHQMLMDTIDGKIQSLRAIEVKA